LHKKREVSAKGGGQIDQVGNWGSLLLGISHRHHCSNVTSEITSDHCKNQSFFYLKLTS
jgi:hypothetical protein